MTGNELENTRGTENANVGDEKCIIITMISAEEETTSIIWGRAREYGEICASICHRGKEADVDIIIIIIVIILLLSGGGGGDNNGFLACPPLRNRRAIREKFTFPVGRFIGKENYYNDNNFMSRNNAIVLSRRIVLTT